MSLLCFFFFFFAKLLSERKLRRLMSWCLIIVAYKGLIDGTIFLSNKIFQSFNILYCIKTQYRLYICCDILVQA